MVDRQAIMEALFKRNALRREANLPLLNIRAELEHELALESSRIIDSMEEAFALDHQLIREQVSADLLADHGSAWVQSMAGRFEIDRTTRKRFRDFLRNIAHLTHSQVPARHPITYGKALTDQHD